MKISLKLLTWKGWRGLNQNEYLAIKYLKVKALIKKIRS